MKQKISIFEHDGIVVLSFLWAIFNIIFYPLICMFIDKTDVVQMIKDCIFLNFDWHKNFKNQSSPTTTGNRK